MIYEHIGLTVNDLAKSIDFYTKALEFEVLKKTSFHAYLYKGTDMIELIQSKNPVPVEKPIPTDDLVGRMTKVPGGTVHIGIRVENIDDAAKKVQENGGEIIVSTVEYRQKIDFASTVIDDKLKRVVTPNLWRIAVFADPDGIWVELLER